MNVAQKMASADKLRPVVGKDVIELLTSAMYVEPLTIYREYIQNAADAVAEAREYGILKTRESGKVEITFYPENREVVIRDNGAGVLSKDFGARLTSIGASAKRGEGLRGFRGVGRLAGLAFAKKLTFVSSAAGEASAMAMHWDCLKLRQALLDADDRRDLAELIADIASLENIADCGAEDHFFEVRLAGVARIGNDDLMSPVAVQAYLSEVAPVSFSDGLSAKKDVEEFLSRHFDYRPLDVEVDHQVVRRPYADNIELSGGHSINLGEVELFSLPAHDEGLAAVGWIAHHSYLGSIHRSLRLRGLRAKVGGMQVGDEAIFSDIFPESRFNGWAIGEVHIVDDRIKPNGRRDDFERNVHLTNLKNQLSPLGRKIAARCRSSSAERNRKRKIELEHSHISESFDIISQHSMSSNRLEGVALSIDMALERIERELKGCDPEGEFRRSEEAKIEKIRRKLNDITADIGKASSPLDRLPGKRREIYEDVFGLIYECSQNRSHAKSLIDKILHKLAQ
ncbi:MAG: ATP-binding protein [Parasphingopyxis sp.]|uniref:ATP-binding protein n=1 Tax=Parasphingopyxis sp. TaxID=1920299 RepID=UPI003FA11F46